MPRKRVANNKGLPPRWRLRHGAYFYRVPPGQEHRWDGKREFRLGSTLHEAHRAWAARLERSTTVLETVGQLLDRYLIEVVPTKAASTRADNERAIVRLKAVFDLVPIRDFKPTYAYRYRDQRGKTAPTAANRELEVLSHAFTKAIEWGAREDHPMIGGKFRKLSTPPRDRYVEDWELTEALRLPPFRKKGSVRMIQAYLKVKLLTGRRRSELLRLKVTDCGADGPVFELAKQRQTKLKSMYMEWSDALRAAIDEALAARPVDIGPYVFCDNRGRPYIDDEGQVKDGWDSIWQRFMDRVLVETKVEERFTEHDIRAKSGSDADDLERARELLAHLSAATTQRIYRRRPKRIKPLG